VSEPVPDDLTRAFAEAVTEAEKLIANPPFEVSAQDLAEGFDYLAGSIRSSLQMAFDYDLEHPVLINPTHQYARQGLDNPDAVYFNAYLTEGASYAVSGVRGTTADLSFQVMDGTYSSEGAPSTVAAFDDRELEIADDGSFEWRFGPELGLAKGSTLIVREVYDDWTTEDRGTLRIQRLDTAGTPRPALTPERVAKRYGVAAKMLIGDDEAMIVTVPVSECAYQAIQIGSRWYVSTDYEHHQTSLTKAQSHADPDGQFRYVLSERNPGLANWLETCGHPQGVMMLRWQRLSRDLGEADGPTVEVVPFDELSSRLPHYEDHQISAEEYTARIAARQVGVARRMIS
jgi:hypothetical protein